MRKLQLVSAFCVVTLLCFHQTSPAQNLKSELLYTIDIDVDTTIDVGNTLLGGRVFYRVRGGTFEGLRLKGKVLPAGGDYALRLDSNTLKLDVKIMLVTEDGELIYNTYAGYIYDAPDKTRYWRVYNTYETASKKYGWLNHIVAVGVAKTNNRAFYDVYEIK